MNVFFFEKVGLMHVSFFEKVGLIRSDPQALDACMCCRTSSTSSLEIIIDSKECRTGSRLGRVWCDCRRPESGKRNKGSAF